MGYQNPDLDFDDMGHFHGHFLRGALCIIAAQAAIIDSIDTKFSSTRVLNLVISFVARHDQSRQGRATNALVTLREHRHGARSSDRPADPRGGRPAVWPAADGGGAEAVEAGHGAARRAEDPQGEL